MRNRKGKYRLEGWLLDIEIDLKLECLKDLLIFIVSSRALMMEFLLMKISMISLSSSRSVLVQVSHLMSGLKLDFMLKNHLNLVHPIGPEDSSKWKSKTALNNKTNLKNTYQEIFVKIKHYNNNKSNRLKQEHLLNKIFMLMMNRSDLMPQISPEGLKLEVKTILL